MLLRQKLNKILNLDYASTPPIPTPCWEWISELFIKTATEHNDLILDSITILFSKGVHKPVYEIILDNEKACVQAAYVNFTFDEIKNCITLAHCNFIKVDNRKDEIAFVYNIL